MAGPLVWRLMLAVLLGLAALRTASAGEPVAVSSRPDPVGVAPAPVVLVQPVLAQPVPAPTATGPQQTSEIYTERKTGVRFRRRMIPPGGEVEQCIAGAGVRTKFLFKVYAVALHVDPLAAWDGLVDWRERGASTLEDSDDFFDDLLGAELPMTLTLVMVRDVDADDMREAFEDALAPRVRATRDKAARTAGLAALERFEAWFDREYVEGTEMLLAAQPDGRLTATVDGGGKGSLVSSALVRALFDVYLGEDPISDGARAAFGRGMVKVFDAGEALAEQRARREAEQAAAAAAAAAAAEAAAQAELEADGPPAADDASDGPREPVDGTAEDRRADEQLERAAAQLDRVSGRQGQLLLELLVETSGLLRALEALGDPLAEQARVLHQSVRDFADNDGLLAWLAGDADLLPPPCLCAFDAQAEWQALRDWLQRVQQRLLEHARSGETAS